jgi:hypothetical protein
VFTSARQQATSPDEALKMLVDGNERFVAARRSTATCARR